MATYAGLYALLALGLNVIWGMGGMINLGLVGFYALGAYVAALAALTLGVPMIVGLGLAAVATAGAGWGMAASPRSSGSSRAMRSGSPTAPMASREFPVRGAGASLRPNSICST